MVHGQWARALCAALAVLLASHTLLRAAVSTSDVHIRYDRGNASLDAHVEELELPRVATRISKATGWKVLYDPESDARISVRFKRAPLAEGLRKLLGDLNYSLIPEASGGAKLLIYRSSPSQATKVVYARSSLTRSSARNVIANELVVGLDPNSDQTIDEIAKELGGKVVARLEGENAYRLAFEDKEAADSAHAKLVNDYDNVLGVDDNFRLDRPQQPSNLSVDAANEFALKPAPAADGKTIIGLIDMPVQPLDGPMNEFLLPSINVTGEAKTVGELSHGTSMAQTVLNALAAATPPGQESSVRVLPVDIYGSSGTTTTFDVARGIVTAVNNGATVLNLSLGGEGDSPFLNELIYQAREQGVMVFAAAGNEPTTTPVWPAANPNVIAVTAADRRGNVAPYANHGAFVDLLAPGTSRISFNDQTYFVSGTSTATAFVSGIAGAHAAAGKTPAQIQAYLQTAFPMRPAGTAAAPPQP